MDDSCRRPTPGGGPGTLSIVDSRTGRRYEIPISAHGTIHGTDLKQITAGGDGVGLRVYDNGYMNITACKSAISFIDGDAGILRYRGFPIEHLAEHSSFLEVSYLVVYGHLPTESQLHRWEEAVMRHSALPLAVEEVINALPHDAHPMGTLLAGLAALSTCHPEQNPALAGNSIYSSKEVWFAVTGIRWIVVGCLAFVCINHAFFLF